MYNIWWISKHDDDVFVEKKRDQATEHDMMGTWRELNVFPHYGRRYCETFLTTKLNFRY